MKLAMYQMKMEQHPHLNMQKSLDALKEAAKHGADLILYPELQFSYFFPQYKQRRVSQLAMTADSLAPIANACREYGIMAAPNLYLREQNRFFDATVLIDAKGKILGCQKMVHIAQAEQFYEQDYYAPSDTGFQVFETAFGKLGIVVCFDRHYPESIRTETMMGADLILIPTANTVREPAEMFIWELRVQAFQNSVSLAMCNRVGQEDQMEFSGQSLVVNANGDVVQLADHTEQLVYAEIDLLESSRVRAQRPYTTLRRTDQYL